MIENAPNVRAESREFDQSPKVLEASAARRDPAGAEEDQGDGEVAIPFKKLKDAWMNDPAFRSEYDRLKLEFALALALMKAREKAGLTQAQVARRMRTTHAAVARIESAQNRPNLKTLERYAEAASRRLEVKLVKAA